MRTKTEARESKASSTKEKKEAALKKVADTKQAGLSLGSHIVGAVTDSSQLPKLKVDELRAVLHFRAVVCPKGAKKPELVELVAESLMLPTAQIPPAMPLLTMAASASGSLFLCRMLWWMSWVMGLRPRVRERPKPRVHVRMLVGVRKMMNQTLQMLRLLAWVFGFDIPSL